MELTVHPEASASVRAALARALELTGLPHGEQPPASASPWLRQALREATGRVDGDDPRRASPYTPSPRRTRGATRA